jgi:hypothetical protein
MRSFGLPVVWWFAGLGGLDAMLLHPNWSHNGVAHSACFTTVVLLVGLAWCGLGGAPRRTQQLVGAGLLAEFLLLFWSHMWLVHTPWVLDGSRVNEAWKADGELVFLNDLLGQAYPAAVVATLVIQAGLLGLLIRWHRATFARPPTAG